MKFRFTDEQKMIRDSAADFLSAVCDRASVRNAIESERGYDTDVWQKICHDMCWQAVHIPEDYDGLGLGYVELAILQEQMGRHLLCAPYFSTVCLAGNVLLLGGNNNQKRQYLMKIANGKITASLAWDNHNARRDNQTVTANWQQDGHNFVLNGELCHVVDGHTVDLLVIAAHDKNKTDTESISLFLCPTNTPGIHCKPLPTIDQTRRLATVRLDNVCLPEEARFGDSDTLKKSLQLAQVALAAEQLGGCRQVLDMTVAYSKERVQFERPIASFQAVKHKAADMMVKLECACSAVYYAACIADEALRDTSLGNELPEAASIAKAYCSDAYFFIAGTAMQLFGGIGFTWEHDLHLYFKRARATEAFLGNPKQHREQLAQIIFN